MYKNYNIFINLILLILIILVISYFFKNNKKLEKYSAQTKIINKIEDINKYTNKVLKNHDINESNLEDISSKIQTVINQINNKIEQLKKEIGNDKEIEKLLNEITTLKNYKNNLEQIIENQKNNKEKNLNAQINNENQINNLHEILTYLANYKRYDGKTIDPFTNNQIVLYNSNGNVINDKSKFNLSNSIKIKIGDKYLKKTNMYYVKQGNNPVQTKIQSTEKLPEIPKVSWLNIMGYHKVDEVDQITTGTTTLSNPNGDSICAFAVWPRWGSKWNDTNKTNLPTIIKLQNSAGTIDLFSKTIVPTQRILGLDVNYWKEIFVSNAHYEDRCQVYFLSSNSTLRDFRIVHNGSISKCAILKNNNGNNNCKSLSITFGRDCTRERPNGAFNVNGETQTYTGLTNPRTFNFTLTERLYHFGGAFDNKRDYNYYTTNSILVPTFKIKCKRKWWKKICKFKKVKVRKTYRIYHRCNSNVIIKSMILPGYNLFNDEITSRRQTLINQTRLHWRLSPNKHSEETPVFDEGKNKYYYKILNYNNALRALAGDYINYLNNKRTQLINFTNSSEFLNYNQSNNLIEYRIRKSIYNQYNFNLTNNFNDATSFIFECDNNTGTNCNIEPDILRMNRNYKIKTLSEGTYVKDLNNILNDITKQIITTYPDNDIINNTNSDPYLLNL